MGVAGNCFIAFKGVMPTQQQQFKVSEGVASGQQVIYSEETSFQALQKLPERVWRAWRCGKKGLQWSLGQEAGGLKV